VPQSVQTISTTAIKVTRRIALSPTCLFVIAALDLWYNLVLCDDEAVVFEDFFVARLCMPPHPALADILLHFQAQLHQLMPNAVVQLPKFFWVVGSFGSVPSGSVFEKRYELHYQPKTIVTLEGECVA
jgi:hypothetical protein